MLVASIECQGGNVGVVIKRFNKKTTAYTNTRKQIWEQYMLCQKDVLVPTKVAKPGTYIVETDNRQKL